MTPTELKEFIRDTAIIILATVVIVAAVLLARPTKAHASTRHHHHVAKHRVTRSRARSGQVRITRYGGRGEWQGTAGAVRLGLPSNTRDLTNAGVMFFAHRSLPFGTRVLFTHGGYSCVGVCVDRGPFSSAVYDFGPILGNELHCQGSDYVTARVL